MQEEAHETMKRTTRRDSWQGLDVCTLYLARSFSNFSLPNHGPGVWTEGDAAAAPSLEVYDCHAEVVGVGNDFDLQINSLLVFHTEDIRAQTTPEVGHLIRVRHRTNLPAAERRGKTWNVLSKVKVSTFPVHAGELPAAALSKISPLWLWLLVSALSLELHAVKGSDAHSSPGPNAGTV